MLRLVVTMKVDDDDVIGSPSWSGNMMAIPEQSLIFSFNDKANANKSPPSVNTTPDGST